MVASRRAVRRRRQRRASSGMIVADFVHTGEQRAMPAVLLLVFRRPEQTRRMFECIRRARPSRLYVAADGPRPGRPGEAALCEEARRIATSVDWPCSVQTLFRNENLGCRVGVSTALDWFFEHENEGIVV